MGNAVDQCKDHWENSSSSSSNHNAEEDCGGAESAWESDELAGSERTITGCEQNRGRPPQETITLSSLSHQPRKGNRRRRGPNANVFVEKFLIMRNLGFGRYGMVRECIHKQSGGRFAVKTVCKARLPNDQQHRVKREKNILKTLGTHKNILELKGCFEDEEFLHIVSPVYQGGQLFDFVNRKGCATVAETISIMKQVLGALDFLHCHDIVHRDVKLENWLFEDPPSLHVRLVDFGHARFFNEQDDRFMHTQVGTLHYTAPDVLRGRYTARCDAWSAGVLLFILLYGYFPFHGRAGGPDGVAAAVLTSPVRFPRQGAARGPGGGAAAGAVPAAARDLCARLLAKRERRRPSAGQALLHRFFEDRPPPPSPRARMAARPGPAGPTGLARGSHHRPVALKGAPRVRQRGQKQTPPLPPLPPRSPPSRASFTRPKGPRGDGQAARPDPAVGWTPAQEDDACQWAGGFDFVGPTSTNPLGSAPDVTNPVHNKRHQLSILVEEEGCQTTDSEEKDLGFSPAGGRTIPSAPPQRAPSLPGEEEEEYQEGGEGGHPFRGLSPAARSSTFFDALEGAAPLLRGARVTPGQVHALLLGGPAPPTTPPAAAGAAPGAGRGAPPSPGPPPTVPLSAPAAVGMRWWSGAPDSEDGGQGGGSGGGGGAGGWPERRRYSDDDSDSDSDQSASTEADWSVPDPEGLEEKHRLGVEEGKGEGSGVSVSSAEASSRHASLAPTPASPLPSAPTALGTGTGAAAPLCPTGGRDKPRSLHLEVPPSPGGGRGQGDDGGGSGAASAGRRRPSHRPAAATPRKPHSWGNMGCPSPADGVPGGCAVTPSGLSSGIPWTALTGAGKSERVGGLLSAPLRPLPQPRQPRPALSTVYFSVLTQSQAVGQGGAAGEGVGRMDRACRGGYSTAPAGDAAAEAAAVAAAEAQAVAAAEAAAMAEATTRGGGHRPAGKGHPAMPCHAPTEGMPAWAELQAGGGSAATTQLKGDHRPRGGMPQRPRGQDGPEGTSPC